MDSRVEALMGTRKLADMRAAADNIPLSPNERHAVESTIGRVESHWAEMKNGRYGELISQRDKSHSEVVEVARRARETAKEKLDAVRHGRISAEEAVSWLREVVGYHEQLVEQHRAVVDLEPELANFEAQSVDDYQAQMYQRHPQLMQSAPTFGRALRDYQTERNNASAQRQARAEKWAAE